MANEAVAEAICQTGQDIRCPAVAEYLDCNYTTEKWKCARERFFIPKFCHFSHLQCCEGKQDDECIYLCGHSLGLQPRESVQICHDILTRWGTLGALSHCTADEPFNSCDMAIVPQMAILAGAHEDEIVIMNSLTVNLHLMLSCFYEPSQSRFKIIHEDDIFSSDKFALDCAVRRCGFDPNDSLVSAGSSQKSILTAIQEHGDSVALVFIGTVQYFTGYRFDIKSIVDAGQSTGAKVGFDLAHAIGVTPLRLHDDNVDFAVWCTYKYLCGGPCSAGAAFIHSSHHNRQFNSRMDGWWSATPESRLSMCLDLERVEGAAGFRISHPNPFQCTLLKPVLQMITCEFGIDELYARGRLLTEYLIKLLQSQFPDIDIVTPEDPDMRGYHVSFKPSGGEDAECLQRKLSNFGIFVDTRKNYIRLSVHPLYTTFTELYRVVLCMATLCYN